MVIIIKRLSAQLKEFIRIDIHRKFLMCKLRQVENILHPEIIFECRHFFKVKMVKKWNVLTEIEHLSFLKVVHVLYMLYSLGEIILKSEIFSLNKISRKQKPFRRNIQ